MARPRSRTPRGARRLAAVLLAAAVGVAALAALRSCADDAEPPRSPTATTGVGTGDGVPTTVDEVHR